MEKFSRALLIFWLCLTPGTLILSTFLACKNEAPIRIGFLAGTSGRVADMGISGRDAAQLVVDNCNRQGGIAGRQVQLLVRDDQQDPDLACEAVEGLIDEGVAALIGPMTSAMALAITPLLNEARLVSVGPTISTQQLSGRDDYLFRVSVTTKEHATRSARFHAKPGGMKRIVAAYDLRNRSYCENWLENFTTVFTALGGEVLTDIGFDTTGDRSFMDVARELLSHGPDGVLIIANSMDAALICQQFHKLDPQIRITLADWGATERLLELGGRAVEGVTVVQPFDRTSKAPLYQAFRKAYLERYQREPGFPGVFTHDATQVVLTALDARKRGQSLRETILMLGEFQGLQGAFSFDGFGDVKRSIATISIVRNQKFVVLE